MWTGFIAVGTVIAGAIYVALNFWTLLRTSVAFARKVKVLVAAAASRCKLSPCVDSALEYNGII